MKKFVFYIPVILIVVFYGWMAIITSISSISPIVIIWMGLFLSSGFLLANSMFWGAIFGMLPGIYWIYMSTKYTGQAISIELPLGIVILIFYILCSSYVYRKNNEKLVS